MAQSTDIDTSTLEENIDKLCKLIVQNPDVKFTFFITPFSIAYWYMEYQSGSISFWENSYMMLLEKLTSYGNVDCYFFADDESKAVITNLDNYCDQMQKGDFMSVLCAPTSKTPELFRREELFPTKKEGTFEGHTFRIPGNPDRYLTLLYGDYMKLPPLDEIRKMGVNEVYWKE